MRQFALNSFCIAMGVSLALIPSAHGQNLGSDDPCERIENGRALADAERINGSVRAQFDWSTPARYGLDANENGIPDLPNSRDYVLNHTRWNPDVGCSPTATGEARFRIQLDSAQSSLMRRQRGDGNTQGLVSTEDRIACARRGLDTPREIAPSSDDLQDESLEAMVLDPSERLRAALEGDDTPTRTGRSLSKPTYRWYIRDAKNEQTTIRARANEEVCLAEGAYEVTLEVSQTLDDTVFTDDLTKGITVEDILIAVTGDSYGAGEGAPERANNVGDWASDRPVAPGGHRARQGPRPWSASDTLYLPGLSHPMPARWADTGQEVPTTTYVVPRNSSMAQNSFISPSQVVDDGPITLDKCELQFNAAYRMQADHYRSHRSSFTHASQLALELEAASDKTSVTFVNVAQTGATIVEGFENAYHGKLQDIGFLPFEIATGKKCLSPRGPRGRRRRSVAPIDLNTLDEGDWEAAEKRIGAMTAQHIQLATLTGGQMPNAVGDPPADQVDAQRSIDSLVASFGGNDAGFVRALSVMLTTADGTDDDLQDAFKDGDWSISRFGCFDGATATGGSVLWCSTGDDEPGIIGLDNLPQAYDRLFSKLSTLKCRDPSTGQETACDNEVYLLGYPFFGAAGRKSNGARRYCNYDFSAAVTLSINSDNFEDADRALVKPLAAVMRQSAARSGVNYVSLDAAPSATLDPDLHGICRNNPPYSPRGYEPKLADLASGAVRPGVRWYRNTYYSMGIQRGDETQTTGQFHPNEYGFYYAKERLKESVRMWADVAPGDTIIPSDEPGDIISDARRVTRRNTVLRTRMIHPDTVNYFRMVMQPSEVNTFSIRTNGMMVRTFDAKGQPLRALTTTDAGRRFCKQASRDAAGQAVKSDAPLNKADRACALETVHRSRERNLTIVAPRDGEVVVGVSYGHNSVYDAVTGLGDAPLPAGKTFKNVSPNLLLGEGNAYPDLIAVPLEGDEIRRRAEELKRTPRRLGD